MAWYNPLDAINDVYKSIKSVGDSVGKTIENLGKGIGEITFDLGDKLKDFGSSSFDTLKDFTVGSFDNIKDFTVGSFDNIKDFTMNIGDNIGDGLQWIGDKTGTSGAFEKVGDGAKSFYRAMDEGDLISMRTLLNIGEGAIAGFIAGSSIPIIGNIVGAVGGAGVGAAQSIAQAAEQTRAQDKAEAKAKEIREEIRKETLDDTKAAIDYKAESDKQVAQFQADKQIEIIEKGNENTVMAQEAINELIKERNTLITEQDVYKAKETGKKVGMSAFIFAIPVLYFLMKKSGRRY